MNTPTDSFEAFSQRVEILAYADDGAFTDLAIGERNALLDEIRRREDTLEARAEERRRGGFFIPAHVRELL